MSFNKFIPPRHIFFIKLRSHRMVHLFKWNFEKIYIVLSCLSVKIWALNLFCVRLLHFKFRLLWKYLIWVVFSHHTVGRKFCLKCTLHTLTAFHSWSSLILLFYHLFLLTIVYHPHHYYHSDLHLSLMTIITFDHHITLYHCLSLHYCI